jgi:hypothetical protein
MRTRDLLGSMVGFTFALSLFAPSMARAGEQAPVGFPVGYPSGASYDAFVATLPGLGVLVDQNGDGAFNDERCDPNARARLAIVGSSLQFIEVASIACLALPSGPPVFAQEICYGVSAGLAAARAADEIVISQCEYQDGLVQAAEISAAYQNTKHILASRLEEDLLQCNNLLSLRFPAALGGRAEEVKGLVTLRIEQFETLGLAPVATKNARTNLTRAVTALDAAKYQDANHFFCVAYGILANSL